jgi:hypothetical protein
MSSTPSRRSPARAGLHREPGTDLVFNPDDDWFSDIPVVRGRDGGGYDLARGELTDAEAAYCAEQLREAADGTLFGVATNHLGQTELLEPGERMANDPRDVAFVDAKLLLHGGSLDAVAARLRAIAAWLDEAAGHGWVLVSAGSEGLVMSDAPDRLVREPAPDDTDLPWC